MSTYKNIKEINLNYKRIKDFDKDSLFLNFYCFWCFTHFFSMYNICLPTALSRLEKNIRKKWVDVLPNVNLVFERIRAKDEQF